MTDKQRFILESVREVFFKEFGSHIPDKETEKPYFDEYFEKEIEFFGEMYDKVTSSSLTAG